MASPRRGSLGRAATNSSHPCAVVAHTTPRPGHTASRSRSTARLEVASSPSRSRRGFMRRSRTRSPSSPPRGVDEGGEENRTSPFDDHRGNHRSREELDPPRRRPDRPRATVARFAASGASVWHVRRQFACGMVPCRDPLRGSCLGVRERQPLARDRRGAQKWRDARVELVDTLGNCDRRARRRRDRVASIPTRLARAERARCDSISGASRFADAARSRSRGSRANAFLSSRNGSAGAQTTGRRSRL